MVLPPEGRVVISTLFQSALAERAALGEDTRIAKFTWPEMVFFGPFASNALRTCTAQFCSKRRWRITYHVEPIRAVHLEDSLCVCKYMHVNV